MLATCDICLYKTSSPDLAAHDRYACELFAVNDTFFFFFLHLVTGNFGICLWFRFGVGIFYWTVLLVQIRHVEVDFGSEQRMVA